MSRKFIVKQNGDDAPLEIEAEVYSGCAVLTVDGIRVVALAPDGTLYPIRGNVSDIYEGNPKIGRPKSLGDLSELGFGDDD